MTDTNQKQLGNTLWSIADQLRGAMDADDFRDYMLSFLFLRYLSDNYETASKKELGKDYPDVGGDARKVPLSLWYANNVDDIPAFEKLITFKVWSEVGPPPGTLYHYPNPHNHQILSIAAAPAPPKIAVQIYTQAVQTKMIVKHMQGEAMEKTLAWAESECEGFMRG